MLKELIRAIYEIAKAIKGNNGESGGGESSNDNGLMGADAIGVSAAASDFEIFTNLNDAINYYHNLKDDNVFQGYGGNIVFLYKNNNFDKLCKPSVGRVILQNQTGSGSIGGRHANGDIQFSINYLTENTINSYTISLFEDTDYYYLKVNPTD